ncbi:MAG: TIR domain-containing protein [Flavobacteriaceae bacterium]|nr:TIR domain-containing protein [Flavobacteriaceae bacterium]
MAYRNKTYVCFDADGDIDYYKAMKSWKASDNIDFNFHDAHDLNNIRETSNEETIKRRLRERFSDTKLLIVLVGSQTRYHYKYVRWEIEVALRLEIPIIAVNIIDSNTRVYEKYPPILRDELVLNIQFNRQLIKYSIDNWIAEYNRLKSKEEINNRVWKDHIYQNLGLK